MRISPIGISNIYTPVKTNNHSGYFQYSNTVLGSSKCDSVSFGRSAENAEALRKLMNYTIPDLYSGKIVITPAKFEELLNKQIFAKKIKNIIKELKPYIESLHDIEFKVFEELKNFAELNPHKSLSEAMQLLAEEHNKKLLEQQVPVFNNLNKISQKMPEEELEKYQKLMDITVKKLNSEAVLLPFSAKEFTYKLQRIFDENKAKNNQNENLIMKMMLKYAKNMPEKTEEELAPLNDIKSKAKKNKHALMIQSVTRRRAQNLKEIEKLFIESSLKNNSDLERLIAVTRAKIYKIPTNIPFNRKSFIYELQKITDSLKDQKLAHQIIKIARELPTSHESVSAFIVKFAHNSSEKIGYNLLCGSVGTIEHLEPYRYKKGANDTLGNYAITSAYMNSKRGDTNFALFLSKNPHIYEFAQKHVDRLIELHNNGTFRKVGLSKWYILNLAQKLEAMSPEEKPLIVDLSKLKL